MIATTIRPFSRLPGFPLVPGLLTAVTIVLAVTTIGVHRVITDRTAVGMIA